MKAKKSFGQHFLTNKRIAERIANSLSLTGAYSRVLEVGPGKGMLTQFLLEKDWELLVVEADQEMVHYLDFHFPALKDRIISGDFLKTDLRSVFSGESFALIGNFPYNISSQILFKMLENRQYIPEMVGMFQKEVAERIISGPGTKSYGVISVLLQAYYSGEYLFTVDRKNFSPPPKVQSAVIRMIRKPDLYLDCNEALFREIVKYTFGQRRKMLRNTLKKWLPGDPILEEPFFRQRPEQLSVKEFMELTTRIENRPKKPYF